MNLKKQKNKLLIFLFLISFIIMPNSAYAYAKEVIVGVNVFINKLVKPNTKPSKAPSLTPNNIAQIITGICIVVALITPRGIYPNGVNIKTNSIATKNANKTNFLTFDFINPPITPYGCNVDLIVCIIIIHLHEKIVVSFDII